MNRLLALILPARALRWGHLTHEDYAWWSDSFTYCMNHVYAVIGRAMLPVIERVLDGMAPVLTELGALMGDDQ